MKALEGTTIDYRAKQAEQKRKAEERKRSAGSGQNFTHNVKG